MNIPENPCSRGVQIFCASLLIAIVLPWAHGAGPEDVDDGGHFRSVGSKLSAIEIDDSLRFSVDIYGYVAHSQTGNWRSGDPLGAGGKLPLAYDLYLYREEPFNRQYSYQQDLLPGHDDFSYIPIWHPNQLETRLSYRFFPRIWGSVSIDYNDAPTKPDGKTAQHAPQISEFYLKWAPNIVPGLSFSTGRLGLYGSYSPIFDQYPLENFRITGVAANYTSSLGEHMGSMHLRLAAGKEFLGRTQAMDPHIFAGGSDLRALSYAFLDGIRERYHLYGTAHWAAPLGFSLGVLAGYQTLPRDSTFLTDQDIANQPAFASRVWPRSSGWQAGGEIGHRSRLWTHHVTFVYGEGDVKMGWSGPDAVQDTSIAPGFSVDAVQRFTRKGSALFQATYRTGFSTPRFRFDGGVWWQDRMPAKKWVVDPSDTIGIQAQNFRAVKFALQPSVTVAGPMRVGVRYDYFHYLDPEAHTNTVEALTTTALRPVLDSSAQPIVGPSRWDREAVNTSVVSPYVELVLAPGVLVRATWSGAWYGDPVRRQGTVGSFHANGTLAAWLTYNFSKPVKDD